MLIRRLVIPDPVPIPGAVAVNFDEGAVQMNVWDSLSVTGIQGPSFIVPTCTSLVVHTSFNLSTLDLTNCEDTENFAITGTSILATVLVPDRLNAQGFQCTFASLDEASVDAICIALAAGTGGQGALDVSGNASAPPSSASAAARTALAGRGWTLTFN